MIKFNPIFEAIGNIDDNIAAITIETAQCKRKPIKLIIIGAVAAAALIIMGCSAAIRSSLKFDDKPILDFNYYPQTQAHILTTDELKGLGAIGDNSGYTLTALPTELLARYNVTPLMNTEYFSEKESEISVNGSSTQAILIYTLTYKETNNTITVEAHFDTNGKSSFGANYISLDGNANEVFSHYEVITLADGSEAFVADRYMNGFNFYNAHAVLCYNGIGYRINARSTDINEMKQILENLGVM